MRVEGDSVMASSFWAEGGEEEGPPTGMRPNADAIGVVRFFFFYLNIEKLFWDLILRVTAVSWGHDYAHCLSWETLTVQSTGQQNSMPEKNNGSCIVLQIHPHYLNNVPHYAVSFISKECSTWP